MKRQIIVGLLFGFLAVGAWAQGASPRQLGAGIIVGEPTGLSVKYWMDQTRALDAAAAWSFSNDDRFQFHADYLIHNYKLIRPTGLRGDLPVYYGLGGRFMVSDNDNGRGRDDDDDDRLGLRIPIGLTYLFVDAPFDLFAEIVPILDVAPDTDFDLNAAIGARFYFN